MSDFLSKIRANFNQNSVWNTEEVNKTIIDLDKIIGTSLDTKNLAVGGTQTVYGQKSFLNMYITSSSNARNYESILGYLQNDISPLVNTGGKGISTDISKELSFSKDNVSGVSCPLADINPAYRKGDILITRPNGTSITVSIKNTPLAAYDIAKLGIAPKTYTNEIGAYYWATSKDISSTTIPSSNFVGGTADGRYEVIIGYNDSDGSVAPFAVKEGNETSLSYNYKSFRRIGFFRMSSGSIINFIQSNGDYYVIPFIGDTTGGFNPSDWIKDDCIITFNVIPSSGAESVLAKTTKTLYNLSVIGGNPYSTDLIQIKVPMFYSLGFPGFSFIGTPTNRYLAKISFGCLL